MARRTDTLRAHLPAVMFVADVERLHGRDITETVARAVAGGCGIVQLRAKGLPHERMLALATALRDVTSGRALLFVNGDVDAALRSGADGVHLPERGGEIAAVRARVGAEVLISRAVHSVAAAIAAERDGADLVVVGTVFPTASKPGATPLGLDGLRAVCAAVGLPCVAIGGITPESASAALAAGADGVAVVGAIADASEPEVAARELRRAVRAAPAGA